MYIKLTRLDGKPIWINSAFVVTIEPARHGGAVVVPIGDGLDYDVRETPEYVLSVLGDAPSPTVVPVPAPKSLTKTPTDLSPDDSISAPQTPMAQAVPQPKPVALPVVKSADEAKPVADAVPVTEETAAKPATKTKTTRAKKTTTKRTRTAKKTAASESSADQAVPVESAASASPAESATGALPDKSAVAAAPAESAKPILSEDQVSRLRRMAPGSIRKLQNTLATQFRVVDLAGAIRELTALGLLTLDNDRVRWTPLAAASETPS